MIIARGRRWYLLYAWDGTAWFFWGWRPDFTSSRLWRIKPFTLSVYEK